MTSPRDRFRSIVADLAAKAKTSLPDSLGRIDSAVRLVLSGDVELSPDGTATVGSSSDASQRYSVNGTCPCLDFARAPEGYCKHRLARAIQLRIQRTLQATLDGEACSPQETSSPVLAPTDADEDPAWAALAPSRDAIHALGHHTTDENVQEKETGSVEPSAPLDAPLPVVDASESIPDLLRDHLVTIQGKPFVKVSGLLALAHARGLQSLTTIFTYNDAELSLAQSTAVFPFGSFTDVGDASPSNCNPKVRLHFRRVAATRSTARALRQGLNIPLVALEELMTDD